MLAALRGRMEPILAKDGFSDFRRDRFAKHSADRFEIVQVEFFTAANHRRWGTAPFSFGISGGIFLKFIPPLYGDWDEPGLPGDTDCHVRCSLFKAIKQVPIVGNLWILEKDLSNLESVLDDAARAVDETLIPWFHCFRAPERLLRLFLEGEERMGAADNTWGFGRKGSPVRNVMTGFTALEAKDYALAEEHLRPCVDNQWLSAGSRSNEIKDKIKSALSEVRSTL